MISYDVALSNYQLAKKEHDKTQYNLTVALRNLELAKRELEIKCSSCNKTSKVKDIEIIVKKSGGYYSNHDDEHHYSTWTVWVCPHCTEPQFTPSEKEGPFKKEFLYSHGFNHYVKSIHEWYSDTERCHGRVLQLLGPYLKRQDEVRAKQERERKIEEAKKVLAEAGILGNT